MATTFAAHLRMLGALSVVLLSGSAGALDASLDVAVDRATVVKAPGGMSTVIVGNPLIADASAQKNGVLVITGKSFGSTNIMLLDGAGTVLSETVVNVKRAADGVVVVQRGGSRESLSCTPRCEPVLSIGDEKEAFKETANQINVRSGMSAGKAE